MEYKYKEDDLLVYRGIVGKVVMLMTQKGKPAYLLQSVNDPSMAAPGMEDECELYENQELNEEEAFARAAKAAEIDDEEEFEIETDPEKLKEAVHKMRVNKLIGKINVN